MNPQHVPVNRPPFLNCHYPDDPLFYFAGLSKLNDPPFLLFSGPELPPFLSFPFTQLPPFFFKVILPNGPPFFTVAFVYLSMIDWNFLKSCSSMFGNNDPLFTTGYQMTPSLAGFFYPNDPTFIALGTAWPGFYSGCLLNDPIFWRVHILPDRPLLLTWSRHIPVTSDRECPPPPG